MRRQYRAIRPVGKGAFGTVYEGELLGTEGFTKRVALKVLNADIQEAEEASRRLRDEARILGLVQHRAIVGVDDLVQRDGQWVLVMEFVEGIGLDRVVRKGPVPIGPALEIIAEVAGALAAAWEQRGPDGQPLQLLHRDIKPSNLRITTAGDVKVLDFGIARADFSQREAETRSITLGTLAYLAPERLDRLDSAAGDVYALGAVLYELLSGRRFGATFAHEPRHRAYLGERVSWVRQALPGGEPLSSLLARMMAFEPDDRPSATELQDLCFQLQADLRGTRLASWARATVPGLMADEPPIANADLSGFTIDAAAAGSGPLALETRPLTPSLPPAVPPVPAGEPTVPLTGGRTDRLPLPRLPIMAMAAGMAVVLVTGIGWIALSSIPDEPRPVPVPPPPKEDMQEDEIINELAEGEQPPPEVEVKAGPVSEPKPGKDASSTKKSNPHPAKDNAEKKKPEPESTTPVASPAPPPATLGRVRFEGGADRIRLEGAGNRIEIRPGSSKEVPTGRWTIVAISAGQETRLQSFDLTKDRPLSISCTQGWITCKIE